MSFYTVSPARLGFQGQVKRTSSPVPKLQKVAAPKDSVHFGNGIPHTYRMVGNNIIEISDGGSSEHYRIGGMVAGDGNEILHDLFDNDGGALVGALYASPTGEPTKYCLDTNPDTIHRLVHFSISN